ncbi:hypothetical protein BUALT_Bualt15G0125400 [Buddleja alternifolia]|uniref:AT-hook motif nuclear-localized protein n=1 Tax=Buddleja alternifolia TaxID=168488 RepID=A0AAV6WQA9_9LAMI|nr:hypothetical protein BUALT_Bualt15G0125400 [Buddleja alternifolia]
MFSKLPHQFHGHHHHSQPQHLYNPTTSSEEADSQPPPPPPLNDGATIEAVRRPRGRPAGSKNKPKPPVVITRVDSSEPSMSPYILELPPGVDVIESTARFCRKRNLGLYVLNGNGVVTDVTLKQPNSTTPGATVTFHGRFDILSISATILPAGATRGNGLFTISLAGPQGQMVGGLVVGPLVAAATIYLTAATFSNPSFHRLEGDGREAVSGGDSESGGMIPIYSYQSSDVIWAPAARPPSPPPPY